MNTYQLPILRSIVSADALGKFIQTAYEFSEVRCWLIRSWDADVYEVRIPNQRLIFRLYGINRRTYDEIAAEMEFLDFLKAGGVSVSVGVPTQNGEKISAFEMAEGKRYGVMFTYAEGQTLTRTPKAEDMYLLGVELGKIHVVGADVQVARHTIDYEYLVNHHLAMFEPYLSYRPDVLVYFRDNSEWLKSYLTSLGKSHFGMCHGDVSQGNAHITPNKKLTFFDFDYCGYGNFIYDVAMLLGDADYWGWSDKVKNAFIAGYEAQRPISPEEWRTVPAFQVTRYYHSLAVYSAYVNERGSVNIPDSMIDRFFERAKTLLAQL